MANSYDWSNQSTPPVLGREKVKVYGGSEANTMTTDLHDVAISSSDLSNYLHYLKSEEFLDRPQSEIQDMAPHVLNMSNAYDYYNKHDNDPCAEAYYYSERDTFLGKDQEYRQAQGYSTNYGWDESSEPNRESGPDTVTEYVPETQQESSETLWEGYGQNQEQNKEYDQGYWDDGRQKHNNQSNDWMPSAQQAEAIDPSEEQSNSSSEDNVIVQ